MNSVSRVSIPVAAITCFAVAQQADAAFRDVQFKTIDFENAIVELHNFGDTSEPFTNWRFCTHDDQVERRYSTSGALNSITLDAGESIFFHFNNDAPVGATDAFNIAGLGNFATPLEQDAYAIGIYVNSAFSNPAALVDHLQWSIDGVDNASADARSITAEQADLWTDDTEWIATTADTLRLELLLEDGEPIAGIHGPSSYEVVEPQLFSAADFDRDGDVDGDDLGTLRGAYGTTSAGDVDLDTDTDGTDFLLLQQSYTGPAGFAATTAVPEPSTFGLVMIGILCLRSGRTR